MHHTLLLTLLSPLTLVGVVRGEVDFDRDVRPILADSCYSCHGPDAAARQADLRLDTEAGVFGARRGGPVVTRVANGKTNNASPLLERVTSQDPELVMPPPDSNRTLTAAEIDTLRRWIDEGAKWARHWAFVPPAAAPLPPVKDRAWGRNAIDAFILARLKEEGLGPSPEASKTTLIRRVTLDLTGLPPTPAEIDAFLLDDAPGAYERVVDRVLASPAYGERMAWEWLDAARYADSNGYQGDTERTMWPWRDWTVDAINAGMPFDRFTIEQLAGDLLPDAGPGQVLATGFHRNHMINGEGGRIPEENRVEYVFDQTETTATVWLGLTVGCARCHDHKFDPVTQREYYQLYAFFNNTTVDGAGRSGQKAPTIEFQTPQIQSRLDVLDLERRVAAARVTAREQRWLAPTDAELATNENITDAELATNENITDAELATNENITDAELATDKNRAVAVEAGSERTTTAAAVSALGATTSAEDALPGEVRAQLARPVNERDAAALEVLEKYFADTRPQYTAELARLRSARDAYERARGNIPRVMVLEELEEPRETFMLLRGAYNQPTEAVLAGVPAALPSLPGGTRADRLQLARWLVSGDHPLTARVVVNRHWQHVFGIGLVKTVGDFGTQGEKPSHPRLLDWLARRFVESGWDLKALHRVFLTSETYRQTSRVTETLQARDPENRLLARAPRYRLPSFVIRDQALALAGLLVPRLGGPPVKPYQPPNIWAEATFNKKKYVQDHGEKLYRRSLYTFWRRIVGPTMFFDEASRQTCTVRAQRTNTPLHALITLNDITYNEAARCLAERALRDEGDPSAGIGRAFRLATARLPTPQELRILRQRYDTLRAGFQAAPDAAAAVLSLGEAPRDESLEPVDHAAMSGICSLLLNLDEVITRE